MGCCASSLTADEKRELVESKRFDTLLEQVKQTEQRTIKLLLLGTGESGKSTIFKQMQILYVNGFTEYEKKTFSHVVRRNVLESAQKLIMGIEKFGYGYSNPKSEQFARDLLSLDSLTTQFWNDGIAPRVKHLWNNEPSFQTAFKNRSKLQILDSAAYFFDNQNLERIHASNYIPSSDDILRARLQTTGITERLFSIDKISFKFVDVGGQRNERRKWIHCFEDVTAVIFVAAIQEYDQSLYEDDKENRLMEAIKVFSDVINNQYFARSTIILFLNKTDLFKEKIQYVSLSVCFKDYGGDSSYDDASTFVRDRFLEVNEDKKRFLFPHFTCATDTQHFLKVFDACKATILSNNLLRLGLQ